MKHYYGYESEEVIPDQMTIIDSADDLFIFEKPLLDKELIPLLKVHPQKTTKLFDDYGFFSDNGNCYLYFEMICAFLISKGNEQQVTMFLFQVEEELIAIHEDIKPIFILGRQHDLLIQKWAASYKVEIEFLIS
ncbi:hypothetical protein [Fictibacillus barbaricus]|uniref:Uncharacterized protein n=1 Tax=Fictibacillus barbaricus TaxID=182136 RepID=A0ABU1TZS5_9BACL|nr:hypothetical protein [Fictibacillus barbaricus]MDR7072724.1 hypothetical protein [Fictibacillus barbaricus]